MTWVAVGVAGAGLISGIIGAGASEKASEEQVAAERAALAQQKQMFDIEQDNEQPYMATGAKAAGQLSAGLDSGSLNAPFTMDTFKQLSPQYQFNLQNPRWIVTKRRRLTNPRSQFRRQLHCRILRSPRPP